MAQVIKIAIMAMGGEGGGVLADWIVDLGESNGHIAQTTSVPGVAQRTGATIYYVELYPQAQAEADGAVPVLALMPLPGDVDVVLASELMEAGRAVQRGLVTPDRTTLIASTHRVYSITEKSALGDGRVDSGQLLAHARAAARRFVCFDMAEAAQASGSVISAVLFGALAATGVLPFSRAQFEATIARGGVGVKPSLAAFANAFERAGRGDAPPVASWAESQESQPSPSRLSHPPEARSPEARSQGFSPQQAPQPRDPAVRELVRRVQQDFPLAVQPLLLEGLRRLVDYQDVGYAALYLDRMSAISGKAAGDADLPLSETARHLALWMSYEDTARVAALKTRGTRFERVRGEVGVRDEQVIAIDEFMHPRLQEICETLPAGVGNWLMTSRLPRRWVEHLTRRGRVIRTSSIVGYLMLRTVAGMKRWRRSTLRYAEENRRIESWLDCIAGLVPIQPELAVEVARCQRLVKGYSDTRERGLRNYDLVMGAVRRQGVILSPAALRDLCDAALADENGDRLRSVMAGHGLA